MCGFAVLIGLCKKDALEITSVMSKAMLHRGPDDHGSLFIPFQRSIENGPGVALSHRRLSILDLTYAGHQPMSDAENSLTIVYNGEVYNHNLLREKYLNDIWFKSTSDTETILYLWKKFGADSIEKLRGIFAFAIVEHHTGRVHFVRDRLGIKPLYWARMPDNSGIIAASEIRSIIKSDILPRKFSREGIESFLAHGAVIAPLTIHRDIREFPTATHWIIDPPGVIGTKRRYWNWPLIDPGLTEAEAVYTCKNLLNSAVSENLLSDVPLGVFLSGGMDSTAVAAIASRVCVKHRLNTLTIDFKEPGYSEADLAGLVAGKYNTNHFPVPVTEESLKDEMFTALGAMEQPTKDGLNTFLVSKAAKKNGFTVVLSGLGGDEVFCGYPLFSDFPGEYKIWRNLRFIPKPLRRILSTVTHNAQHRYFQKFSKMVLEPNNLLNFYLSRRQHVSRVYRGLLGYDDATDRQGFPLEAYQYLMSEMNPEHPLNGFGKAEIHVGMINTLVRDSDCMSMANSLELRVPLLDHRLLEFNYSIPDRYRLNDRIPKHLLYKSMEGAIPDEVVFQPKKGFVVPTKIWLKRKLMSSVVKNVLKSDNLRALNPEGVKIVLRQFYENHQAGSDVILMLISLESYLSRHDLTE